MKKLRKYELKVIFTFLIIGLFLVIPFFPQTEVYDVPYYDFDDKSYGNFTIEPGRLITLEDLSKVIGENLTFNAIYADSYYYLVKNISEVRRFLELDNTNLHSYTINDMDCDDFAFMLAGRWQERNSKIALGIMYMQREHGAHAVNFFLDDNLTIWIIEPITDSICRWNEIRKSWRPYVVIIT